MRLLLLAALVGLAGPAQAAEPAAKAPKLPANFTATFVRAATSGEAAGGTDRTRGMMFVRGAQYRFELNLSGRDPLFAIVFDFDKKSTTNLHLVDKTVSQEKVEDGRVVDMILNVAWPIVRHALVEAPDDGDVQCGRDKHYLVKPSLGPKDQEKWDALQTRFSVCLSAKGLPSMAYVSTVEGGRPWRNVMTLDNVRVGTAKDADFRVPAGFKPAP